MSEIDQLKEEVFKTANLVNKHLYTVLKRYNEAELSEPKQIMELYALCQYMERQSAAMRFVISRFSSDVDKAFLKSIDKPEKLDQLIKSYFNQG